MCRALVVLVLEVAGIDDLERLRRFSPAVR